jgi:hypothetical protein
MSPWKGIHVRDSLVQAQIWETTFMAPISIMAQNHISEKGYSLWELAVLLSIKISSLNAILWSLKISRFVSGLRVCADHKVFSNGSETIIAGSELERGDDIDHIADEFASPSLFEKPAIPSQGYYQTAEAYSNHKLHSDFCQVLWDRVTHWGLTGYLL